MITVANTLKAYFLYAKSLRFKGGLKVVEEFWKVGPEFICPICYKIGHDCLQNCRHRLLQYMLCAEPPKLNEYRCRINGCQLGFRKKCNYIMATYINCWGNPQTILFKCPVKYKTKKKARKIETNKKKEINESEAD